MTRVTVLRYPSLWWRVAARTSFEERLSFTLSCHRLLISEFYCLTDPLPVDISILKEMDLKLLFYTLILVNYSKQDAEVITKRKFVSKARSEYIKVSKASGAILRKKYKSRQKQCLNFWVKLCQSLACIWNNRESLFTL